MKRLLTTLAILLVVLIAGMSALVLLVNPNDFRAYMVKQVEKKYSYQLSLEGDMRWHVWPRLSIISGRMSLIAPGATTPVVSAENMRLDVKLWPLLSHQLAVKQVMLKGAVVRLTPDSEAQALADAPVAPAGNTPLSERASWSLDIGKVQVVDSLLIWQRANDDQINIRDINLLMEQGPQHQVSVSLSSRVNRDQRDLTLSLAADVDMQRYPQQIMANISQFSYKLEGADVPVGGIVGQGALTASYQKEDARISIDKINISANDNVLTGSLQASLGDLPDYRVDLQSDNLNLDKLFGWQAKMGNTDSSSPPSSRQQVVAAPVIANQDVDVGRDLQSLRDFTGHLALTATNLVYRGISVNKFTVLVDNQQGKLTVNRLSGQALNGEFSFPGTLNITNKRLLLSVEPVIQHMDLGPLLKAADLPLILTGQFSMTGQLSGVGFDIAALSRRWNGNVRLEMKSAQLHGMNIQQLIQQAVTRSTSDVTGPDRFERYTEVSRLQANLVLNKGLLSVNELNADSALLLLKGSGTLNLPAQQADMNLIVRIVKGWRGQDKLVSLLQTTDIPLRIYGPWSQLKYQLEVEKLLRKELQQRAKSALNEWVERNKNKGSDQELKKLLDKL
ncbi:outer membrane assembly protein AsmA [Yersinia ruckeri]|uniref:outer membrane assembly protein AsmA n=1 Tax=Yersinia ruckeri TaxID=29486 RepID=UPI002264A468|nr:outer membrane assembly protein AsmA [Yersinia ruckeri]UZX67431.1 outer membrane assembly protein AsmA [Yersinia ruckeri]